MTPRTVIAGALAIVVFNTSLIGTGAAVQAEPRPGAIGLGDKVWPELGNGGYDVISQHLAFTFATDLASYTARTTLTGRATQALNRFDLDLLGPSVTSVKVNGVSARWTTTKQGELVITPVKALARGSRFVVQVGVKKRLPNRSTDAFPPGLVRDGEWIEAINQPSGARRMLAVSDHPAQKAPTTFTITAPSRLNSIANGRLVATVKAGPNTTRVFREDRKIATELIQIGVGPFTVLRKKGPHGIDLRYAVPTAQVAAIEPQLKSFDESLAWLEKRLGRYPGRIAGAYINPIGGELETQGLTLLTADAMTKEGFENNGTDGVVLHELAHEWFGNSVSPERWADLWLNEGHAVYYQIEWSQRHGTTMAESMRQSYTEMGNKLLDHGPIGRPDPAKWTGADTSMKPFSSAAYSGGALVLYALRQKVGAAKFEAIERAWVRQNHDALGSTEEFIATASKVSGQNLAPFLRSWLYGTTLPPMPGHPDWKPA